MSQIIESARESLASWLEAKPHNFYDADRHLHSTLRLRLGETTLARHEASFSAFGALAAGPIDGWARITNQAANLPRLERYDGIGRRTETIVFHPDYHAIGRAVYRTGVMSGYAEPGGESAQLVFFYLLGQDGEAGHCCPLACTAGLIKLIQRRGDKDLQARFLPALLDADYDTHAHGSQFLTEVQGGSDVGANALRAEPDGAGGWLLSGEKWFCSAADAQLYLVTARPAGAAGGTGGLGAFIVPRLLEDGQPNGIHLRRLKDKLGTRSMASAEIDFVGAHAVAIGEATGAFKDVVEVVLDTSRLYNAMACAAAMRRAEIEARAYGTARQAFGGSIERFPLVRRSLALIAAETRAAVASTFYTSTLADRMAVGRGGDEVYRLLVNVNKYWTSVRNTQVLREAIEVLGGNGAIEEFSVLPRLYRDAIVLESWEGTHNVLCAQIARDIARYALDRPYLDDLRTRLAAIREVPAAVAELLERLPRELDAIARMHGDAAALAMRPFVEHLALGQQSVCLLEQGDALAADHLLSLHLPRAETPAETLGRIDALLAS